MKPRSAMFGYGVGVVAVVLGVGLRWALDPWLGPTLPYVTLFGFVAAAVWLGGTGPGFLTALLAYLAATWWFAEPRGTMEWQTPGVAGLFAYLLSCGILIAFGRSMRLARRRAEVVQEKAEQAVAGRRRAEEELRLRSDELTQLLQVLPAAVWVAQDPSCSRVVGNLYAERLLGVDAGSDMSSKVPDGLPLREAIATRAPVEQVGLTFEAPNGDVAHLLANAVPLFEASGEIRGAVSACVDVTRLKEIERLLRETEERFRELADSAPVQIWIGDAAGRMVHVNARCVEYCDLPLGELIGEGWYEVVHPQDREHYRREYGAAAAARSELHMRIRLRRRDGRYRWFDVMGLPRFEGLGFVGFSGINLDVTERKEAEEALRLSEERLRVATEAAGMFTWDGDLVTGSLQWSDNAADVIGCAPAGLPREPSGAYFFADPREVSRVLRELDEVVARSDAVYTTEYRGAGEASTARHFLTHVRVIYEGERPTRLLGVTQDVTGRKRIELTLREREASHRLLIRLGDQLRSLYDPIEMQRTAARLLATQIRANGAIFAEVVDDGMLLRASYARENAPWMGRFPLRVLGEAVVEAGRRGETMVESSVADSPAFTHSERELLLAADIGAFVGAMLVRDGRWVAVFGPYSDESRQWTEAEVQLVRDVAERTWEATERARTDAALRTSEERFRSMADATPAMVWTADPSGAITFRNRQWLDYAGLDLRDDASNWGILHPEDRERCTHTWEKALREEVEYRIEARIRRHDGEYRWFLTRATPIRDRHGRVVEWYGSTTDIHELKKAEEALRVADRQKDEFLAVLAHELRNPLAPIGNAVEILRAKGGDEREARWSQDVIARQVRQMSYLLDDLLDVSRITRGRLELRRTNTTLTSIVETAVETSRPLIEAAGHDLVVRLPDEPVELFGDPVRLSQVLSNLLNNAAKFTPEPGRIRLEAEVVGRDDEREVAIWVQDTGEGIAPEMLPRIFDMFAQSAPAKRGLQSGLGIGLSLAKGLVELHGGSIEAQCEGLGRGSTFRVRLPARANASAEEARRQPDSSPEAVAPRRILVVDDLRDSADALASYLSLSGHEVHTAYGGEEALELAERLRPDVVLLDVGMPEPNGYEVCRRLRANSSGSGAFVVALTGWGQEEDRRRTAAAGFDMHLVKPVDKADLARALTFGTGSGPDADAELRLEPPAEPRSRAARARSRGRPTASS